MKNLTKTLILLPLLTVLSAQAEAACYLKGFPSIRNHPEFKPVDPCPNCAGGEISASWQQPENRSLNGADFSSEMGAIVSGAQITYSGPATAGRSLFSGAPLDVQGSATSVSTEIAVSINWRPDMQEYCSKHKTVFSKGRKCVEKKLASLETSFALEILNAQGYRQVFKFTNVNNLSNTIIDVPALECNSPMSGYEARVRDLTGGSVDFTVHSVKNTYMYQY